MFDRLFVPCVVREKLQLFRVTNMHLILLLSLFIATEALRVVPLTRRSSALRMSSNANSCNIKVVGVGGGGGNAIMRMIETGVKDVDFIALNTDTQALDRFGTSAEVFNIGAEVTRGLGAGGVPDNGRAAAEESAGEIRELVAGADLVFVTAGMGGGTGSGAAPIVADIARESGALTVGVVTKPFGFEGRRRMQQANQAIEVLKASVDTLITVSNDRLLQIIPDNTPVQKAFSVADDVLRQGIVGISEIIIKPGLINVDFADVRSIMGRAGTALMGIGKGSGKNRAADAATAAISSPLLDFSINSAKGVVFNVVGGSDMTLQEINSAAEIIYDAVDPNANIIFGSIVDDDQVGEVTITVIATGFPQNDGDSATLETIERIPEKSRTIQQAQRLVQAQEESKSRKADAGSSGGGREPSSPRSSNPASATPKGQDSDDVPDFLSRLRRRR